ncbi:GGDEF domain-containing protein [Parasphingorhabdus halotolerans]|uniref:diguanylate cyclase n=1 Tax=Parasphingorhabdus halotolerans TaxID=2725558 RepID=A0A6H2DN35_9SPHN|nr:GGDEF domain-containing protein [Parasphingorhabdus halotolerans]QJB69547.1 GGDEF domain-containing protein [Parasphingorhabdus halotolerans]
MVRFSKDTSQIREASIISAIAVLLSFAITGSLYILFFGFDERFWGAMALAITVPWGISIPLSFYMSKQRRKVALVAMRLKEARQKLRDANKTLEHKASYDGLTGLFNREHFLAEFEQRRMASSANVLLIIDADHFKDINDGYGHPIGDKALILISTVFKRMLRKDDLVGRIGGEEFGILLPDTVEAEGEIIAEMIRHEIESIIFEPQKNVRHRMTVSIGITGVSPHHERALPMRNADTALFEAKRRGRNQCVLYKPGMRSKPRPFYEAAGPLKRVVRSA